MGRSVKVRISFQADIAFLTRLSRAVEMDPQIDKGTKKQAIGLIVQTQSLLMEIERKRLTK